MKSIFQKSSLFPRVVDNSTTRTDLPQLKLN